MLTLNLHSTYDVKDAPVKIGTYQSGEYNEITVHMDFRIPSGFTRAMLHHQTKEKEAEFYGQLVLDWKGISDEDGNPIPCEGELKKAVLQNEAVVCGILHTLTQVLLGVPLVKNLEAGSAS